METKLEKPKMGRPPGPPTKRYQVLLEPELAEWAKKGRGGLSETLRRLIQSAKDKEGSAE